MAANRETAAQLWGKELARTRRAAGLHQEDLGRKVHASTSTVAMWETGRRIPKPEDAARCDTALGIDGFLERLLTHWVSREVSPQWLEDWLAAEDGATTLKGFEPIVIPGLLQTEEYARALLQAGIYYREDVEEKVRARMERQKVLDCENPPFLVILLDESTLRRNVGGPQVMADQLRHLITMAQRQNIVIHVLPLNSLSCGGFAGPFCLASFDGKPDVAYVDNQLSGEVVDDPAKVGMLRQLFERFRADALSKQASIEFIRKVVADQWPVP